MITQKIELHEEPKAHSRGSFVPYTHTPKDLVKEIQMARDAGLVIGTKFRYKHNLNRVLTVVGYSTVNDVYNSYSLKPRVILCKDITKPDSNAFNYSVDEILNSDSVEIVK